MGLFSMKSSCNCNYTPQKSTNSSLKFPNPDPRNFKLLVFREIGNYLIVRVRYPNCINYEGEKIMVYKGITASKLASLKFLDPHFCENTEHPSPIARFEPTNNGWEMALAFAKMMNE